jgi:hypothetical protein
MPTRKAIILLWLTPSISYLNTKQPITLGKASINTRNSDESNAGPSIFSCRSGATWAVSKFLLKNGSHRQPLQPQRPLAAPWARALAQGPITSQAPIYRSSSLTQLRKVISG